jgi:DNA polymerase I
VVGVEGYEADDVIATLACTGAERDMAVYICSSDKDCRQLLNEHVQIFNLRKREVFDVAALEKDWGVRPDQVIDLQALVGDSIDNVPGVVGVGIKTAAKLLQEYDTLEGVLEHIDEIAGAKKQENLRAAVATLPLARQLVKLSCEVPIKMEWDEWRLQDWDDRRLLDLFREWGFYKLAEQVREVAKSRPKLAAVGASKRPKVQQSLFDGIGEENGATAVDEVHPRAEKDWHATYHLVNTPERFEEFFAELKKQPRFAVDVESTHLEARRAELVGLAFTWKEGEAWYVPLRGPVGEPILDLHGTLELLKPLLEDPQKLKLNQNIKYDLQVLRGHGIELAGLSGDPMVADYLLHAGERSHNMEVLADKHLHHQVIPITDLIGKGKKQLSIDQVATAKVAEYAGEDADVAWRLAQKLEPILEKEKFKRSVGQASRLPDTASQGRLEAYPTEYLYDDLEIPLIEVLAELEYNGIRLDIPFLNRLGEEMTRQLAGLEKDIHKLAGREFNIASLKQLRQVLFDELKLPAKGKTAITGEASTAQAILEKLAKDGFELPQKLVEHRKIAKLKGTYVDALPELVHPKTGRIHASFNQTVASTGRLSSSDPNLQNIPIRSEQGEQVRQAFLPETDWVLLTADYSQIELRLLAHLCGDEALQKAFADDRDIHASVAAQIFNVPEADVNTEQRRMAKTVNFGVIYGISAFGLGARLEMDKDDAAKFIDAYFARYPKVLDYQQNLLKECIRRGYVSTILGRRRAIRGIRSFSSYKGRNQPEREAINMEIQGSAADLIKVAMLNIYRRLKREQRKARMLLQIHDELVFESPPEELDGVAKLIREEMTGALADRVKVPLKVDVSAGVNWLEVKEVLV